MACLPGGILHRLQALASTPSLLLFRFLLQKSFDRNQKQHVPICADLQQLQQIIRLYNHTERMRLSTGLIFQYSAMIAVCHQKYMIVLLFYIK